MELVNDRANQAGRRAIGRVPQRVADLGRSDVVLQQQRKQNGGISRECIEHRVLLGGIEEYLANGAVRKIANVHPVTVTGVLDVERERAAPMWQATPGGHGDAFRFEDAALSGKILATIFGATLKFFLA
jgi:hypothetical protein